MKIRKRVFKGKTNKKLNYCRVFNINVKAAVNVTQVVAGDMKRRNVSGSIVNVSSQVIIYLLRNN